MGSWNNLPAEVLLQVLLYLKDYSSTLQQCQLTCRAWRDSSHKQFHRAVNLVDAEKAQLFVNTMSSSGNFASKFVKSLTLGTMLCDSPKVECIFPRLFDLCSNIVKLETPLGQKSAFWAKLLLEQHKGNVSHLREIPLTDLSSDDHIKLYGYVAYELRDRLTNLIMCDWPSAHPTFSDDRVAQQLQDFQRLDKLDIHLRGHKSIYEVFAFIQKCFSLKSVNISVTDINRNSGVDYVPEGNRDPGWYDIQSKTSVSNINRLNVEYIPLTNKIIQYIMHLFPKLDELYFKSDNPNWEEDMDLLNRVQVEGRRIPADVWLQFLLYLDKNVNTFDVSNLFITDIPNVLANFIQRTNYGDTLRLLYLERDSFFDFQPYIGIDSKSGSKKYTRGQNFYEHRSMEVVFAAEEDHYEVLPHLAILERIGQNLKALEVLIIMPDRFADTGTALYNMACGYFLDHTFQHCPTLDTLCLQQCLLEACNPDMHRSESIRLLRMDSCTVKKTVFTELSARLPNLSYLVLRDFDYGVFEKDLNDENNPNISFDMPHTSFDAIRLSGFCATAPRVGLHSIEIKVTNGETTVPIITFDHDSVDASTPIARIFSVSNRKDKLTIEIICKDIKTLVLEINQFSKVVHFDGDQYQISALDSFEYEATRDELN